MKSFVDIINPYITTTPILKDCGTQAHMTRRAMMQKCPDICFTFDAGKIRLKTWSSASSVKRDDFSENMSAKRARSANELISPMSRAQKVLSVLKLVWTKSNRKIYKGRRSSVKFGISILVTSENDDKTWRNQTRTKSFSRFKKNPIIIAKTTKLLPHTLGRRQRHESHARKKRNDSNRSCASRLPKRKKCSWKSECCNKNGNHLT